MFDGRLQSSARRFLMGVRGAVLLTLDTLVQAVPKGRGKASEREKVLVVRLDRIGDFLLWLDAARAYRELYPPERYELILLAHPLWAGLAREVAVFDAVWELDPRRFMRSLPYRCGWLMRVRRAGFAVTVQARRTRKLLEEDALTRAGGAPLRAGLARAWESDTHLQKRISDRWYTSLADVPPDTPELAANALLLHGLGLTDYRTGLPRLDVPPVPPALMETLTETLTGQPYFVLFPGASWSGRQWPLARFAVLAERIHQATGWAGVICGGPEDAALGEQLSALTDAPLQNQAGRTNLTELAAVIGGARLVVSNDTSGVHMAAATGTRAVCILGGGHFGRFLPYPAEAQQAGRPVPLAVWTPMPCFGCGWNCIYPVRPGEAVPCIASVTAEMVWQGIQDVLQNARNAAVGV